MARNVSTGHGNSCGAEQGVTSVLAGETVHEFVHDGRHLLGFPCR